MPSFASITAEKLLRLIGTPGGPVLIDVRDDEAVAQDPFLIPGSIQRAWQQVREWAPTFSGRSVIAYCQKGKKLGEGSAAWLRTVGAQAEVLEGGIDTWRAAGLPLVPQDAIARPAGGETLWVTRSRPKIDRIACPWLIRRFVDPSARFLFVTAAEVEAVAERFGATPFDIEGVRWSHRAGLCTFDVMLVEFGLTFEPLQRLGNIVRGADTGQLDLAPEAAGLLAISLGLSRMYSDDLEQLDAGMGIYDALYRWCREATDETHNWPSTNVKR